MSPSARARNRIGLGPVLLLVACALAVPLAGDDPLPETFQIRPQQVEFRAALNGPAPPPQNVTIATSLAPLTFDIATDLGVNGTPPPEWLAVSPLRFSTPGKLTLTVTRTDLAPGVYRARILSRAPAGALVSPPSVPVTLILERQPAVLSVAPDTIRLAARTGGGAVADVSVVRNTGGGGLDCRQVRARPSEPWLAAAVEAAPGECRVRITANPSGLRPRPYAGSVGLETPIRAAVINVSFLVTGRDPAIRLNPLGQQFEARQGQGSPQPRNISVNNIGDAPLSFRAEVVNPEEAPWLTLTGTSATVAPGAGVNVTATVSPDRLAPGVYYALVRVRSDEAVNAPLDVPVAFRVLDPNAVAAFAAPSPSGLVFNVAPGSGVSAPQLVQVFASSTAPVPFQAAPQTFAGGNWLLTDVRSGVASTAAPGRVGVSVNPGSLAPGVYRGDVNTVVLGGGELQVRTVNVTMVIRPPGVSLAAAQPRAAARAADCAPTRLSATHTGLVNNFATRAGWPTPLNVRLVDDCGALVTGGRVTVTFSTGEPPLPLYHLRDGNYAGTWAPARGAANVTATAEAIAGSLRTAVELAGTVAANVVPVLSPGAVLNGFSPRIGAPVAPGAIVQVMGSELGASEVSPPDSGGRLADQFGGVAVLIGGLRLPLYYLSPRQINAQVPFELKPGVEYLLLVRSGTTISVPQPVGVAAQQPGLAARPDGIVTALDQNFNPVTRESPASRGAFLTLYLVGMGVTDPAVPSGTVSPGAPPATLAEPPQVRLGDRTLPVLFAGLTPGLVGVYQVNIQVPEDFPPGDAEIQVTQDGAATNAAILPVR